MIDFFDKYGPIFELFQNFCFFGTLYEKLCHGWNIYQKENNLWHWIDKYADLS